MSGFFISCCAADNISAAAKAKHEHKEKGQEVSFKVQGSELRAYPLFQRQQQP